MTKKQALYLVGTLRAAFPEAPIADATVQLYVAKLMTFTRPECAAAVVERIVDNSLRWPKLAEIRQAYKIEVERQTIVIEPPDITEEARAENVRQARAMVERLTKAKEMPGE